MERNIVFDIYVSPISAMPSLFRFLLVRYGLDYFNWRSVFIIRSDGFSLCCPCNAPINNAPSLNWNCIATAGLLPFKCFLKINRKTRRWVHPIAPKPLYIYIYTHRVNRLTKNPKTHTQSEPQMRSLCQLHSLLAQCRFQCARRPPQRCIFGAPLFCARLVAWKLN